MTDPLLPPGIRVEAVIGEDERSKVCLVMEADLPDRPGITATSVFRTTREARALGALLIKQADLIDQAERGGLRVVGGREG